MGGKATRTPERDVRQNSHENSSLHTPKSDNMDNTSISISQITPNLNLEGLELVLHWFTATAATVAGNPAALQIVQTIILKQAMKHQFLLHGILALSALHLAHSHSGKDAAAEAKYTNIATAHHNQGLVEYQSILKDITEENYSSSIAFSSITVMYAFAQSRPIPGRKDKKALLDDLVQIFVLGKGWQKVVSVSRDLDCHSNGDFMSETQSPEFALAADTEVAFTDLQELNARESQNDIEKAIFATAIGSLKEVFRKQATPAGALDPHTALGWTNTMHNDFVDLLRERRPLALVITAYYCVVLDRVPEAWWLSGWSEGLLDVIWRDLGLEYRKEADWAREKVRIGVPSEALQGSKL